MAETPGICTQTTNCETARSGRSITVPLGSPFVCPECSRGLVPPLQASEPVAPAKMPVSVPLSLVGAGLLVLGGAVFLGRELGAAGAPPPVLPLQTASSADARPQLPKPMQVPTAQPPAMVVAAAPAAPVVPLAQPASGPPVMPSVNLPAAAAGAQTAQGASAPAKLVSAPPVSSPPGAASPISAQPVAAPPVSMPAASLASVAPPAALLSAAPAPAPSAGPHKETAVAAVAGSQPAPAFAATPAPIPAATPTPAPVALAVSEPPVLPTLADQPFSPVPVIGGAPSYPADLAADGRPGRVAVTCLIQADGAPSGCHASAGRSSAPFATAALAWLAHGHVRFRPVVLHGHAAAVAKTWTVAIEEPPALLAEARRKQSDAARAEIASAAAAQADAAQARPAPAPLHAAVQLPVQPVVARQIIKQPETQDAEDRPFSTHVLAGGAPTFPGAYDETRPGAVTVSCTIGTTGSPSGCRVLRTAGGGGFGKSVEAWAGVRPCALPACHLSGTTGQPPGDLDGRFQSCA